MELTPEQDAKVKEYDQLLAGKLRKWPKTSSITNIGELGKRIIENQIILNNNIATAAILAEWTCKDQLRDISIKEEEPLRWYKGRTGRKQQDLVYNPPVDPSKSRIFVHTYEELEKKFDSASGEELDHLICEMVNLDCMRDSSFMNTSPTVPPTAITTVSTISEEVNSKPSTNASTNASTNTVTSLGHGLGMGLEYSSDNSYRMGWEDSDYINSTRDVLMA